MTRRTDILQIRLETDGQGRVRASLAGVGDEVSHLDDAGGKATRTFGALKSAIGALGLGLFIRELIDASLAMQSIESSFRVATGSAQGAAQEFKFVREEADRLGLALRPAAEAFSSLEAAAHGTSLEGQASRDIFVGISEAMTALGRGAEESQRALLAIEQIISKGTVSAEELRGQLGEVLPGAFQLAARAIGVTTQELNKMLAQGQLLSEDLLPAMARELHNTFGEDAQRMASGLQAEINRLKTSVFELMGGTEMDDMTAAIRDITELISDPGFQEGFDSFVSGVMTLAKWAGEAAAGMGRLGKNIGETVAAAVSGPAADDIPRLQSRIRQLKQDIAEMTLYGGAGTQAGQDEMMRKYNEIFRLEQQIRAARATENKKTSPAAAGGGSGGNANSVSLKEISNVGAERIDPAGLSAGVQKSFMQQIGLSEYGVDQQFINIPPHAKAAAQEIDKVKDTIKDTNSVARELGLTFSSAFEDAIVSGKSLRDVLGGILQDIERILIRKSITEPLANAIGGFDFGSLFGGGGSLALGQSAAGYTSAYGFADGGSFTIPGAGGTDSKRVVFDGTPGERVTVETPDQQRRGGGDTYVFNVDARGADASVDQRIRQALSEAAPRLVHAAKKQTLQTLQRPEFA